MLEENMTFEKKEGASYPPLPKGIYQAELLDLKAVENETYDSKTGKTTAKEFQTDLNYQFTLLNGTDEKGESLRGRNVWENYGHSFLYDGKNGKNNLWRIAEAFLGRLLTQEEEATGIQSAMLNSFIGKQVQISVEPKTSKQGKTFDNIIDYLKINSELPSLTEEEKENAKVKKKDGEEKRALTPAEIMEASRTKTSEDNINVNNIPFG